MVEIRRKENELHVRTNMSFNREVDLVLRMVDVYSAAEVNRKYWLSKTDRLFFAAMYLKCKYFPNIKCSDDEVVNIINSIAPMFKDTKKKFTTRDIYGYTRKLVKNGWLVKRSKSYCDVDVPDFFKNIDSGYVFNYDISFSLNASDK